MNFIKEIKERNIETEIMTRKGENLEILKKRSSAKTYRGYLDGKLKKTIRNGNKEMEIILKELIRVFNEFYPQRIIPKEIEIISGWKGKDVKEIYKGFEEDFIIKEHIKDKETGEVSTITHPVAKENVNRLLFWIKQWEMGEMHKCYDFAEKLGWNSWKDLWRERKIYFETYYFPIKVLEAIGIIKYSGRGEITRMK